MKKVLALLMVLLVTVVVSGVKVAAAENLTGIWKTVADEGPDKGKAKSHLQIYEANGVYNAKVVKLLLKPQDTLCDKCKGALYNKPVVGMNIFSNMKKTGKVDSDFGEEYAGGQIMDPDNGKFYTCKIWIKGDTLVVRGYLGPFYRTQRWYRVK
ncbi:MAG TPA: DUF2147 domain-containing protein [Spirochaetota bacterium]|nr:DUF2147 domain-containing protein [Spirochaetota bacterium]HPC39793.1 DUF2147 domain-containing protein [Spirochaetota bacterium]HPL17771.1 DUF2147 domain-containing protein [Spirochaetota bacterium]HQF09840.1 DUF2147 domain-containing protein [Spirochaetota bacterium]HQH98490.1 DUF2147 domain-containing protein [Spirochaetota bacterium]